MNKKNTIYSSYKSAHWLDRLNEHKNGSVPSPVCAQIDYTNNCNNRCNFCFYHIHDHLDDFSMKDALPEKAVSKFLDDFAKIGGKSVEKSGGGEPLLVPYFDRMSQKARSLGLERALVTNGKLLDKHIDEVKDYSWVRVSINSGNAESYARIHGTSSKWFGKVINNLEELCKNADESNVVGVSFITTDENYKELPELTKIVKGCGVDNFRISVAHTPRGGEMFDGVWADVVENVEKSQSHQDENFRVFSFSNRINDIEGKKGGGECLYHHLTTAIGANGGVYPCCYFKGQKKFNLGNINEESFIDIWNGSKRLKFIKNVAVDCKDACWMQDKNEFTRYLLADKDSLGHLGFP